MKAFTVSTNHPEWMELTREFLVRLKRYAGIDCEVVIAADNFDAHIQKLVVPLRVDLRGPLWFFDSDWWMIREAKLPDIPEGGISATFCRAGYERYWNSCVDIKKVFGTTLWGADMSCPKIRKAFIHALHLQSEYYWNGRPGADESFLNIAVQQAEVPVTFFPADDWNRREPPSPTTIAIHAGGMWPKLEWMKKMLAYSTTQTQTDCVSPWKQ